MDDKQRPPLETAGWGEYRRLILSELERISRDISTVNAKVEAIVIDMATIKERARNWGFVGGIIASSIVAALVQLVLARL